MRVNDKLEHSFPCKVCNENKPTGLKTNVLENVQSILDGLGRRRGRGLTYEKNVGVGIQIIQLLRNNQSKRITYKYDLWKIIIVIIIICNMFNVWNVETLMEKIGKYVNFFPLHHSLILWVPCSYVIHAYCIIIILYFNFSNHMSTKKVIKQ